MVWSTIVLCKGVGSYAVNAVRGWIRECGYKKLFLKSDDEPSILALKNEVRAKLEDVEILLTESTTGDHRANGDAEVTVREIKRQVRVLKTSLEENGVERLVKLNPYWRGCHGTRDF